MADGAAADSSTPKRKRQFTEKDQKLAKIYNDLADERNNVRIQAAIELVAEFSADQEPSGEFIERTLARLIKGLCSGRKAARVGFSIALSELLRQFYCSETKLSSVPDLGKLIVKLSELTELEGSVTGQVSTVSTTIFYTLQVHQHWMTSLLLKLRCGTDYGL